MGSSRCGTRNFGPDPRENGEAWERRKHEMEAGKAVCYHTNGKLFMALSIRQKFEILRITRGQSKHIGTALGNTKVKRCWRYRLGQYIEIGVRFRAENPVQMLSTWTIPSDPGFNTRRPSSAQSRYDPYTSESRPQPRVRPEAISNAIKNQGSLAQLFNPQAAQYTIRGRPSKWRSHRVKTTKIVMSLAG